ncbi:MAG: ZIP family metal transporter [Thermoplasmatales archaeon]|nr:ZIP family metal transporter [Thermoplasmatales archaeon]
MIWLYAISSVIIVSLISLIGLAVIWINDEKLRKVLIYLVAFSAGGLFGGAFLHLLPEMVDRGFKSYYAIYIILGIIIYFLLEKIICWRHCHILPSDKHPHTLSFMILFGDILHNLIDGLIIGASYMASLSLGVATTIAVILHEIPQEIGDFGSLLYGGFNKSKALLFNFLSALTAIFGTLLVLIIKNDSLIDILIPVTIGGFIYIAGSDLVPELHKESNLKKSFLQLLSLSAGIIIMYLLTLVE